MGWASGSRLLEEIANKLMKRIPPEQRRSAAAELIDAFEGEDCDTIGECEQEDIRAEYDRRNPDFD